MDLRPKHFDSDMRQFRPRNTVLRLGPILHVKSHEQQVRQSDVTYQQGGNMVAFQTLLDSFPDAEEMDASHS